LIRIRLRRDQAIDVVDLLDWSVGLFVVEEGIETVDDVVGLKVIGVELLLSVGFWP